MARYLTLSMLRGRLLGVQLRLDRNAYSGFRVVKIQKLRWDSMLNHVDRIQVRMFSALNNKFNGKRLKLTDRREFTTGTVCGLVVRKRNKEDIVPLDAYIQRRMGVLVDKNGKPMPKKTKTKKARTAVPPVLASKPKKQPPAAKPKPEAKSKPAAATKRKKSPDYAVVPDQMFFPRHPELTRRLVAVLTRNPELLVRTLNSTDCRFTVKLLDNSVLTFGAYANSDVTLAYGVAALHIISWTEAETHIAYVGSCMPLSKISAKLVTFLRKHEIVDKPIVADVFESERPTGSSDNVSDGEFDLVNF